MERRNFIKGSAIVGASIAASKLVSASSGLIENKNARPIYRILNTSKTKVGTLPILRAFAGDQDDYVSPFVLFDEFGPVEMKPGADPLRVEAHPHAGVTPTTYFLAGNGHHKDSLNYDFQIAKGDFMMFSSGRGAIHMEETGQKLYDDGGLYHGFQIWLNIPSEFKFIAPTTHVHRDDVMDEVHGKNFYVKVIMGELFDAKSKIELLSPAFYYHVKMEENCRISIPTDPVHNAFVYVVSGDIEVQGNKTVKTNQLALYKRGKSDLELYSKEKAELLVLGGQPLDEVVFSYGPFVMNTEEQIKQCIMSYQSGQMGDPEAVNR